MPMNILVNHEDKQGRPRVIEIIGPAGAGKTTLCNVLSQSGNGIRLSNFPDVRKAANAPFFISYGSRLIPTIIDHPFRCDRWLSRREFAWLTILNGWPNILQKELKRNNDIILLDQGPVYLLTETSEFGPEYLRKKKTANLFWEDLYSQWADVLDMVVWLDATDLDLVERIRSRDKGHVVKDRSIEAILEFLVGYRKAYERVISCLSANHPELKILRINSSQTSLHEIAGQLLIEFRSAS
jgi:adenylate kinase family enzyme